VGAVSLLSISFLPYVSHHKRTFGTLGRVMMVALLIVLLASLLVGLFWEVCFVISLAYVVSPLLVPAAKRSEISEFVSEWRKEQSDGLQSG
jgi:phosphatidylserine synthase